MRNATGTGPSRHRKVPNASRDGIVFAMNNRTSLEKQLANVVVLDVASADRRPQTEDRRPQTEKSPVSRLPSEDVRDPSLSADRELVQRLQERRRGPRQIEVRQAEHDASPHSITIGPLSLSMRFEPRDDAFHTVGEWEAPYEAPPHLDILLALADDLSIAAPDPFLYEQQFTPASADVAWSEQYAWWKVVRRPFVKWVPAGADLASRISHRQNVSSGDPSSKFQVPSSFRRFFHRTKEAVEEVKAEEEELLTQVEAAWGVPAMVPKLAIGRVLVGFTALLVIVSLPAGAVSLGRSLNQSWTDVQAASTDATNGVAEAVGAGVPGSAAWSDVSSRFERADQALGQVSSLAVAVSEAWPGTRGQYTSARSLVEAGGHAADAAKLLTQGLEQALAGDVRYPVERVATFRTYLAAAIPLLDQAAELAQAADPSKLPEEVRARVTTLQATLDAAREGVRDVDALSAFLSIAAGERESRTYLLVFQNNTELRPTGGFMGSVAEVDVDRGEIKKVLVPGGGPYDLRSQLREVVAPPQPLQLVASRWEFQDANWFPDFAAAAAKIRWFWSRSGQPTLDGVIAVNATILEKLLAFTGPIDMPEYGKVLTKDNVMFETQKAVELEYDKTENTPKKFIGDLLDRVIAKVKDAPSSRAPELISLLAQSLTTKDIQVWMSRADEEAEVEHLGWSGLLKPTAGDALALVEANIAGQKTDGVIDEAVREDVQIASDGSVTETVTLTRTHQGQKGELFRGVNNVSYLRVYVPEGSELVSADGFDPPASSLFKTVPPETAADADVSAAVHDEGKGPSGVAVTKEFGRTAFGGWLQLAPGETRVTRFQYRLPFTVFDLSRRLNAGNASASDRPVYLSLLTSQSGKSGRTVETHITYPKDWTVSWQNAPTDSAASAWDRDRVTALLFDLPHEDATESR